MYQRYNTRHVATRGIPRSPTRNKTCHKLEQYLPKSPLASIVAFPDFPSGHAPLASKRNPLHNSQPPNLQGKTSVKIMALLEQDYAQRFEVQRSSGNQFL